MCQAIKDGGKRCPAQLASSRQMITTVTEQFPSIPRTFAEKIFCQLVASKSSVIAPVIHASNFEALTGTRLVPDPEIDQHVAGAQNRLYAVTARLNRTIESSLTEIASFSGISKETLGEELHASLSSTQKSEKYKESVRSALRAVQEKHLQAGEVLSRSPESVKHSTLGAKYIYHAPSGHLEIKHSFLGMSTDKTQAYKDVTAEQWDAITHNKNVDLTENFYRDSHQAELHGKAYRCQHCGQFQALSHSCPARQQDGRVPSYVENESILPNVEHESSVSLAMDRLRERVASQQMQALSEYLEEAGLNPDDAEKIESEHRENIARRSQVWNKTIEDLANNKESQQERLERINSLAFQGFAAKKDSPLSDDNHFTGGSCDPAKGGRGFGLEIEAAVPAHTYYDIAAERAVQIKVRLELYRRGIVESIHEVSTSAKNKSYSGWNVHEEEPGLTEIVSPVLSDTKQNWEEIQEVCEVLREYGYTVSPKTGGHVNIDTSSFGNDRALATELSQFNTENASLVNSFSIGKDSAGWRGNKYSGALNENLRIAERPMKFEQVVSNGKNKSVNLQSLDDDDAVVGVNSPSRTRAEYRSFNGTLDVEEWKHRVLLAGAITDFVQLKHASYDDSFHDSYETYVQKNIPDFDSDSRIRQTPATDLKKIRDFITLLPISTERKQSLYSFARRDIGKKKWE